jgi:hypothetical protein
MAFLEFLSSLGESPLAASGRSMLAPLVRQGLSEGMSANAMLRELRAAGLGLRRQSFLQLVGEVKGSTERAGAWAGVDLTAMPGADMIQEWHGGQSETYLHRVYAYYRSREAGDLSVYRKGFSILSRSPMTPAQAIASAADLWGEGDTSGDYAQDLLGFEFSGIYHQLGSAA